MLAALLLNLADYQKQQGGSGALLRERRKKPAEKWVTTPDRNWSLTEVWNRLDTAVDEVQSKPEVKRIKKLKPRIKEVVEQDTTVEDLSNLIRDLSMAEFELKKSLPSVEQTTPEMVLLLESLTLLINYLEQDEEDVIVLLLSL